jgi:MYXO-CTERM domain-containing protein
MRARRDIPNMAVIAVMVLSGPRALPPDPAMKIKSIALTAALVACTLPAQAGSLTLSQWAFGAPSASVSITRDGGTSRGSVMNVWAGALSGSLTGAGAHSADPFVTYCVELEEMFNLSTQARAGYAVVPGADYFQRRRGDAGIAERIGALMSWEAQTQAARTADTSSAMQLAIWNLIYDSPADRRMDAGMFHGVGSRHTASMGRTADSFMSAASGMASDFDVFVVERAGSQDFLVLSQRQSRTPSQVPTPATLALALLALAGAGFASRRRA